MNLLRTVVSGPKQRFVDKADNHDLDLVYLTDRIILMGYPASGLEAMYRNKMAYVLSFLDAKHRDHYRVFNLCPLSENSYEPTSFHGRISRYPFPDHHAPPLALLHLATEEMALYLGADEKNVVAIHCKAGKGRTGTLACSLVERLGGPAAAQEVHGMLNGSAHVPGRKEDPKELVDNGEADEGGSVSLPAPGSDISEEPVLSSSTAPPAPAAAAEKKHAKRKSVSKKAKAAAALHPAAETLDFHTSRRMASPNLLKPGVSIPSQRRFLRYFVDSLALARKQPPALFPGEGRPKPMLRLKEVILVNAHSAKDELTPKVRGEAARYSDALVSSLDAAALAALSSDAVKKAIVDGAGGLGIGMSGVGTDAVGFEDEKASVGGGGMIRGLGALREAYTETGEMDWDAWGERSKDLAMCTHHLQPETELIVHPDRELKIQVFLGAEPHQSVKAKPSNLLARGVRGGILNVLLGQNTSSLGWLWLVPSFHIPSLADSPLASPGAAVDDAMTPARTHTLSFPREIVDFRSKTLRSVSLAFEEVRAPPPSPTPTPDATGARAAAAREGREKGEVLPPDSQRPKAEEGGLEGAAGGTEYK